ncbi:hypothetical protein WMY93_002529 [Mugilogobius chulae]|uniref:L1 transposable element RRM domain-containing protein n=1 Tax=Mugilogobius chulae TaxID=88201 RepID=A0AAW0PU47_9GOBI
MPLKTREKDHQNTTALEASVAKKNAIQRVTRSTKEDMLGEANEQELPAANLAPSVASGSSSASGMDQLLAEIREVAKKVSAMDNRLDSIDGSLIDIKSSVAFVENSIATLGEQVSHLETRADEAESRISTVEDSVNMYGPKLNTLEKSVEFLRQKMDSLENEQRRKNLKIVNFPDKVEKEVPLSIFLQSLLPGLVGLSPDCLPLDIEYARRRHGPDADKPGKTVLVRFSRTSQRDAVIRAAMNKIPIKYEGFNVRFYPDLPADILRRRREFDSVKKVMSNHNMYRGFAYPARLRCLHGGHIRLFETPGAAVDFLQSIKIEETTSK